MIYLFPQNNYIICLKNMQKFILEKEVNILKYYLNSNPQPNHAGGNYEIHKETCQYYYKHVYGDNFKYLGIFYSDIDVLLSAKRQYPSIANRIDGCAYCCHSIHKG